MKALTTFTPTDDGAQAAGITEILPAGSRYRFIESVKSSPARRSRALLGAVIAVFSLLCIGAALTSRPWCDEGWFASIVYSLTHHGVMALTVLDPHGFIFAPYVKGIHQYDYWVLPGYIFAEALWSSIVGLTPFTMRLLSTMWGAVALASWYVVVRHLCRSRVIGVLAAAFLALDQNFVLDGSTGRMDMMCAALSFAAPAIYLQLRRNLTRATLAACSVLAVALLTHPNALFGGILLALLGLTLDRHRLQWRHLALAAAPFVLLAGLWFLYVLQAPDVAASQFAAQSKIPHRFVFDLNPWRQFGGEIKTRYAWAYHFNSSSPKMIARGVILVFYFAAVPALLCLRSIRRRPGAILIACFALISFALLSCFQNNAYYLVYVLPGFSAALAICIVALLDVPSWWSRAVVAAAAAAVLLNLIPILSRIKYNTYRNGFEAAVSFLKQNAGPDDLIIGSGELAFGLGFDGRVVDDCRLGYGSGRRAQFIVMEGHYYALWLPWLAAHEPATAKYIKKLLDEDYRIIYDQTHGSFVTKGLADEFVIFRRVSMLANERNRIGPTQKN